MWLLDSCQTDKIASYILCGSLMSIAVFVIENVKILLKG